MSGAAGVLRFGEERDPLAPAQSVSLRIDPEDAYRRHGIEAARETGNTELRMPYESTAPERDAVYGYPLGRWPADVRRSYSTGTPGARRVMELETLETARSAWGTAWTDGLAVAKDCAAVHGHFLPPTNAVWGAGSCPDRLASTRARAEHAEAG